MKPRQDRRACAVVRRIPPGHAHQGPAFERFDDEVSCFAVRRPLVMAHLSPVRALAHNACVAAQFVEIPLTRASYPTEAIG